VTQAAVVDSSLYGPERRVVAHAEPADDLLDRPLQLQVQLVGFGHDRGRPLAEGLAPARVVLAGELGLGRVERHPVAADGRDGPGVERGQAVLLGSRAALDDAPKHGVPDTPGLLVHRLASRVEGLVRVEPGVALGDGRRLLVGLQARAHQAALVLQLIVGGPQTLDDLLVGHAA